MGDTLADLQLALDEPIREGNITPLPQVRSASTRH
jgi:hypothetical protein